MNNERLATIWRSSQYQQLRTMMLENKWPNDCYVCQLKENHDSESPRLPFKHKNDDLPPEIERLQLKFSNYCNLVCRMCYAGSSSSWVQHKDISLNYRITNTLPIFDDALRNYIDADGPTSWLNDERAIEELVQDLPALKRLEISGGEPLLTYGQYDFIKKLSQEEIAPSVALQYITNLSYPYKVLEKHFPTWEKFRSVNLQISIDGTYDVYNYIRHQADFSLIEENLKKVQASDRFDEVAINCTVQSLNVFQIPEIITYFSSHFPSFHLNLSLLTVPDFLAVHQLPDDIKSKTSDKLVKAMDKEKAQTYLNQLNRKADKTEKLIRYIDELDQRFGGCFDDLCSRYLSLK